MEEETRIKTTTREELAARNRGMAEDEGANEDQETVAARL